MRSVISNSFQKTINYVFAVTLLLSVNPSAQAQPQKKDGILDKKTLTDFIIKYQDTELPSTTFDNPKDVSRKFEYLERDFAFIYKPEHEDFNPAYKYDQNNQQLDFGLGYLPANHRLEIFNDKNRLTGEVDPSYIGEGRVRALIGYPSFNIAEKSSSRKFVGQNAFGVKRNVTERVISRTGVVFLNVTTEHLKNVKVTFEQLAPSDAKVLVENLVWRVTGRTAVGLWSSPRDSYNTAWAITRVGGSNATLSNPNSLTMTDRMAPALLTKLELIDGRTRDVLGVIEISPPEK